LVDETSSPSFVDLRKMTRDLAEKLLSARKLERLKKKAPILLLVSIFVVVILIVVIETLEDILVEGGSFPNTLLAPLLSAIVTLAQYTTSTVSYWGYSGIFLLMFLESSSLPIPSEVVLPFAGYLVSLGRLSLWLTIAVSTLAGTAGCLVDYYVGMKAIDLVTRKKGRAGVLFGKARMETVTKWFNKYGSATVFLSRLVPGFRTLISFPAGALRMPLTKFVALSTIGCLLWNTLLICAGDYLGTNWREIAGLLHYVVLGIVGAVLITVAAFIILRRKRAHKRRMERSS
jgi:membrane protein DedA with SNARE-associated domain